MMPREYRTAEAFRKALEDRLNKTAGTERIQVNRLRRQVAFDRLRTRRGYRGHERGLLRGGRHSRSLGFLCCPSHSGAKRVVISPGEVWWADLPAPAGSGPGDL
jgi:hypothetical protein